MTVIPDHPEVRSFLMLQWRHMEKKGRGVRFHQIKEPMYRLISVEGAAALFSYQGFWRSLKEHLEALGHSVEVQDVRRRALDMPEFAMAARCLLPYQRPWIMRALATGDSGLLGAPTRYGKTYGMEALLSAFPSCISVVTAPGVDLCEQLFEHFSSRLPRREVRGVFTGSRGKRQALTDGGITVCSLDSLDKMDADMTDLLLVDEPHACVSTGRLPKVSAFSSARKYGFGATLKGRFDRKDRLIEGLIGPVLSNVTYLEGVEQGAIAPLKVLFMKLPFSRDTVPGKPDRDVVYERLLTQSRKAASVVRAMLHEAIPRHWQAMAFIRDEAQALFYLEHAILPAGVVIPEGELIQEAPGLDPLTRDEYLVKVSRDHGAIAMAKRMTTRQRRDLTKDIAAGKVWRVLPSNIYVQGVTFPDLKVVINLAGGGANTTAIQKPGRLLQKRPGKRYGVMVDIMLECRDAEGEHRQNPPYEGVVGECWARHNTYKEVGYDIEFVEDISRIREVVAGSYEDNT